MELKDTSTFEWGNWAQSAAEAQARAHLVTTLASDHMDGKHQEKIDPDCVLCWPSKESQQEYWEQKEQEIKHENFINRGN